MFKRHKRFQKLRKINPRVPYLEYRPVDYFIHKKFFDRKSIYKLIDQESDAIFTGDIDALNKDLADNPILAMARSEILNLFQQRISHEDVINRIGSRQKSDINDIKKQKEDAIKKLDGANNELEKLNKEKEGEIHV